jgi:hypothetical protein
VCGPQASGVVAAARHGLASPKQTASC